MDPNCLRRLSADDISRYIPKTSTNMCCCSYWLPQKMPPLITSRRNQKMLLLDKKKFQHKIENIFLPITLAYVLGAQKNCLIETTTYV